MPTPCTNLNVEAELQKPCITTTRRNLVFGVVTMDIGELNWQHPQNSNEDDGSTGESFLPGGLASAPPFGLASPRSSLASLLVQKCLVTDCSI